MLKTPALRPAWILARRASHLCDNSHVKIKQTSISPRQRWLNKPIQANQVQSWLIDNGSLTASLQYRYKNFAVKPLAVKYAKANSR